MKAAWAVGDPLKRAEPTKQRHLCAKRKFAFHLAARSYKIGPDLVGEESDPKELLVQVDVAAGG